MQNKVLLDIVDHELTANVEQKLTFYGRVLFIETLPTTADLAFYDAYNQVLGSAKGVRQGFSIKFPESVQVSCIGIKSTSTQQIRIAIAQSDIEFNQISGSIESTTKQANIVGDLTRQTLNSTAETQIIVASTVYKRLIFTADKENTGSIYIGGGDISKENAAIILEAGESYIETVACAANFHAIADNDGDKVRINVGAAI